MPSARDLTDNKIEQHIAFTHIHHFLMILVQTKAIQEVIHRVYYYAWLMWSGYDVKAGEGSHVGLSTGSRVSEKPWTAQKTKVITSPGNSTMTHF